MTQPDLVEGGEPRSRRTSSVAVAVVVIILLGIAWRASLSQDAPSPPGRATTKHVAAPTSTSSPTSTSTADDPTVPVAPEAFESAFVAANQELWLDSLPRSATRPSPYVRVSPLNYRVVPSGQQLQGDDFRSVAQLRDAAGRWVDMVTGSMTSLPPPLDSSGRYLAFTVDRIISGQRRPHCWVYVVSTSDARVVTRLRLETGRYVAGWLGNRVVLDSYSARVDVQLLDWQRATPVLDDLGASAVFLGDRAGTVSLVTTTEDSCLDVWRFTEFRSDVHVCPGAQILAMSADGRYALTHDMRWVSLRYGKATRVAHRPEGVLARSASFLPDGSALVDLSLDGRTVDATLLCSRGHGCRRVPPRTAALQRV